MRDLEQSQPSLRGRLLVAHPSLEDPNFERTVVLVSAHSVEDGALGVVLNRPLNQTLGELQEVFVGSELASVPVYSGGPVATDEVLLAAWKWDRDAETFQLFFGVSAEKLEALAREDPELHLRAFAGYSGWSSGQVESELAQKAWVVAPIQQRYLNEAEVRQWRSILDDAEPELRFLADAPDDPSLN